MTKLSLLVLLVAFAGLALSAYGCTNRVARQNAKSQYWLLSPTAGRTYNLRVLTRLNRLACSVAMGLCSVVMIAVVLHPIGR
jgi:hypothetical protein